MRGTDARLEGFMKPKTEHWFSPKGIVQNFKSIRWLPLKNRRDGSDGLLMLFAKTISTIIIFALIFLAIDAIYAVVLSAAGLL